MNEAGKPSNSGLFLLGLLLALGMSAAAFILGVQGKDWGRSKEVITVKGVAEKAVKADSAQWRVGIYTRGATMNEALEQLKTNRPKLEAFLKTQGLAASDWQAENESAAEYMVSRPDENGNHREVQEGYYAQQYFVVNTKALDKVQAASKQIVYEKGNGLPFKADDAQFLVSGLEDMKISLIGAATQNARQRAGEFAKNGNVKVGAMRSASQGTFSILNANQPDLDQSDYGGSYDKTTIDKIARVVVTIQYQIEN